MSTVTFTDIFAFWVTATAHKLNQKSAIETKSYTIRYSEKYRELIRSLFIFNLFFNYEYE
jgi:hypothetical protein